MAQESSSDAFTNESLLNLMNVIELGLEPLSETHDVEVQERAKNVVGFIGMIKQEIAEKLNLQDNETKDFRVATFMKDVFSEELGPISATAQERVCVPDGLELKENLNDLDEICGEFIKPLESNSVSYIDKISFSVSKLRINDQNEASSSSSSPAPTSLLAEHRKRHGMYYLTSHKSDPDSNNTVSDYPLANELASEISVDPNRKPKLSKPRPVVVKLDEGDESRISSQGKTKPETVNDDESLSQAIQTALMAKNKGKEKEGSSENPKKSEKKKKKKSNGDRSSSKHRSRRRNEVDASSDKVEIPDFLL